MYMSMTDKEAIEEILHVKGRDVDGNEYDLTPSNGDEIERLKRRIEELESYNKQLRYDLEMVVNDDMISRKQTVDTILSLDDIQGTPKALERICRAIQNIRS